MRSSLSINAVGFELITQHGGKTLEFNIRIWTWPARLLTLTSNDVMTIQDEIVKGFGSGEETYSMGVNDYFGPIQTHRQHATPN